MNNIILTLYLLSAILLNQVASASTDSYRCEIKYERTVGSEGTLAGYKRPLYTGNQFYIDGITGRLIGDNLYIFNRHKINSYVNLVIELKATPP